MGMSLVEEKEAGVADSARSMLMACTAAVAAVGTDGVRRNRDLVGLGSGSSMACSETGVSVGVGDPWAVFDHGFQVGPHTRTGRFVRIDDEYEIRDPHSNKNSFLPSFPSVLINTVAEVEGIRAACHSQSRWSH